MYKQFLGHVRHAGDIPLQVLLNNSVFPAEGTIQKFDKKISH
jgi:hypothetical protein